MVSSYRSVRRPLMEPSPVTSSVSRLGGLVRLDLRRCLLQLFERLGFEFIDRRLIFPFGKRARALLGDQHFLDPLAAVPCDRRLENRRGEAAVHERDAGGDAGGGGSVDQRVPRGVRGPRGPQPGDAGARGSVAVTTNNTVNPNLRWASYTNSLHGDRPSGNSATNTRTVVVSSGTGRRP